MILRTLTFATLYLLLPVVAHAADVVLRERAVPAGQLVRLGDVAAVTADTPSATEVLAATPLMVTPGSGDVRFLRPAQVRDLLVASGVDVSELRITGAQSISIMGPAAATEAAAEPNAANASTRPAVLEQLSVDITRFLRQQSGHDLWEVTIVPDRDFTEVRRHNAAPVLVTGGKAPWTGRQRFTLTWDDDAKAVAIMAQVERVEMAAFAVHAVEQGDLVRAADVELRPFAGNLPARAISSIEAAVGKEAVQSIRPGAILLSSQLRAALIVHRGERVSVRARAGGVTVRTYATAQQDGSLGDLVMVTPLDSKERYAARVSGVRELEIFAGGAVAADVATYSR